jgi:hypothetical protein
MHICILKGRGDHLASELQQEGSDGSSGTEYDGGARKKGATGASLAIGRSSAISSSRREVRKVRGRIDDTDHSLLTVSEDATIEPDWLASVGDGDVQGGGSATARARGEGTGIAILYTNGSACGLHNRVIFLVDCGPFEHYNVTSSSGKLVWDELQRVIANNDLVDGAGGSRGGDRCRRDSRSRRGSRSRSTITIVSGGLASKS